MLTLGARKSRSVVWHKTQKYTDVIFSVEDQGVCLWPPGQREQGRGVASNASVELIANYLKSWSLSTWLWGGNGVEN